MKIAIKDLKELSKKYKLTHLITYAYDGKIFNIATYGDTVEHCDEAALGGNKMKTLLGWPENLQAEPNRVKKLKEEIKQLKKELKSLKDNKNETN